MTGLVREVLGEMPEAGSGHHLQMHVGALPTAVADRGLLRQVWANLLANAIKYSRQSDPAIIEVGGAIEADEAHFFVRDNGVGFDMQYAGKLFQVFQRLHRDPVFEGTGVGLAIVARIVQRHGGRVWAEGEPDKGAIFHFTLPQAQSPSRGD
jgi:light-regulated signal transduction histidine kinase (bacteriophytochrome)